MTTTTTAPASLADIADIADDAHDLTGIHPHLDTLLTTLTALATTTHTPDQTASILTALAGPGPNVITLIGQLIAHHGATITNLDEQRTADITTLTAQYALYTEKFLPSDYIGEAAAAIAGLPYSPDTD